MKIYNKDCPVCGEQVAYNVCTIKPDGDGNLVDVHSRCADAHNEALKAKLRAIRERSQG